LNRVCAAYRAQEEMKRWDDLYGSWFLR